MSLGVKLLPLAGINLDVANAYLQTNQARFIKNLYYQLNDTAQSGNVDGSETGKMKPVESNAIYCPFALPAGDNIVIGTYPSRETKELYVFVYNSLSNHTIFRINGSTQTADVTKPNPCFNFQLSPEYWIGEGQCYLDINTFIDADSSLELIKKDLYWTDGFGYQGYLRFDDYLQTNGFDADIYPYFKGGYDRCSLVRVGLPTPKDCVTYTEVAHTVADDGLNNEFLFQGTQLRITPIDVFGRPSEHGVISNLYIPGVNDCIASSSNLARCLDVSIDVNNPLWDKVQIEYSTDNSNQWYIDAVLNLYSGSALNKWWLRGRNPNVVYNASTGRISYQFCRNKECTIISVNETNKLQPALARRSQAVGKVGQRMGFANGKYGFNPFPQSLIKKMGISISPPSDTISKSRQVTIYVPIWNDIISYWQHVDKDGTNGFTWGTNGAAANVSPLARQFSQYFKNLTQSGFTGYLVGGGSVISTQVYPDGNGGFVEDTSFKGNVLRTFGGVIFQKFVFNNIAQGRHIFRLASTLSDTNVDLNYRETSTTVWGVVPFNSNGFQINQSQKSGSQELIIDVCNEDYNTLDKNEILVIASTASPSTKTVAGYVYETAVNGYNQNPIELCNVSSNHGQVSSGNTDHNGFYYYGTRGSGRSFSIDFIKNCSPSSISSGQATNVGLEVRNFIVDQYQIDYSTFNCNHILVTGKVLLQGTIVGIPNVTVTLTRGRSGITDNNGDFSIICHDDMANNYRLGNLIISTSGCGYTGQGGACISLVSVVIQRCSSCGVRIVNTGTEFLQYNVEKGLLSGGSYGFSYTGYDWLGRKTAAQVVTNFTVPSIIQSQSIGASVITATIDSTAVFPSEIAYIIPSITAETTQSDYLTWIVDNVAFIDSAGNTVVDTSTASQIKIYYASIIEYNKQNNYNTTTAWQFISLATNTPEIADKIQFFINGDGKFFTKSIIALVKYNLDGQYILIDYNSDLAGLKANALVRLSRPKVCTGNEPYYEVCQPIAIVNRKATVSSFILNAFDTYYLSRQIPVPVIQPIIAPATVATYINELRILSFRFEHHSPSNFWGYKIWNKGRLNIANPYEAEILQPDEIQLSGVLSINGQTSYIQNFDESQKKNFIVNNSGGIVYFRVKSSIIAFITQYNNFITGYGDNLVRVVNGQVQVPSADGVFGNPERRANGDYGCTLFDKNTIREREGLIHFVDTSRVAILQHNFSDCFDVSKDKIISWLMRKVKYIQNWNLNNANKKYFASVINPANFEYIITDFTIGSNEYVNQKREIDIPSHESFAFDIYNKAWKAFYSATPEYSGYIEGEKNGQQLFSFMKGMPYYYYTSNEAATFGTIFGQQVERVYDFIITAEIMKKQDPIGIQIYCKESGYFADLITTEAGQQSRILKEYFKQGKFMYFAPFLRDIKTFADNNLPAQIANPIVEGNPLFGEWVRVRLIGYPESNTVYSQLSGVIIFTNGDENTGAK